MAICRDCMPKGAGHDDLRHRGKGWIFARCEGCGLHYFDGQGKRQAAVWEREMRREMDRPRGGRGR